MNVRSSRKREWLLSKPGLWEGNVARTAACSACTSCSACTGFSCCGPKGRLAPCGHPSTGRAWASSPTAVAPHAVWVQVVLGAAMWNNPHILVLDEPTNYLDRDSLGALAEAIKVRGCWQWRWWWRCTLLLGSGGLLWGSGMCLAGWLAGTRRVVAGS